MEKICMRVAIEIQPVLDKHLTGVGWYTDNFVRRFKDFALPEEMYYLLGMDFYDKAHKYKDCLSTNVHLRTNGIMHYGIYRRIWKWVPFLDYGRFFKTHADIFHFFNFVAPPRVRGKVIITIYDMVYKVFPETMEKANYKKLDENLKRSCDAASAIVTISQNSKDEIIEYMGVEENRIHIIPPGVDTARYHPYINSVVLQSVMEKYHLPEKYFLYLGTIEPRKNVESIIKAFRIFNEKKGHEHYLVIAGKKGWMYDEIFKLVEEYGLQDAVIFPGYVDEEDKPMVYAGATAFIFPSLYEGFGMPPLEAMACGVPVISSNSSSLPEVVGDAGVLTQPMDVESISLAMERLTEDYEYHNKLVEKGLKQASTFSWEASVEKLLNLYRYIGGIKDEA